MDMSYSIDQIGSTQYYRVVRTVGPVVKWLAKKNADGTIIWGDPHVPSGDDTNAFEFSNDAAVVTVWALNNP